MTPERWELGSELHLALPDPGSSPPPPWARHAHRLYGSGRDALAALMAHGRDTLGWKRLLIPDFLCQEVAATLAGILPVRAYPCLPTEPFVAPWEATGSGRGDAALVVNTFGLRVRRPLPAQRELAVIEDHTHDPFSDWAEESEADFAVASLRKTLPIPDGGVLWSPRERSLPGALAPTEVRERASHRKLAGMVVKTLYLAGAPVEKDTFRRLAILGESEIAGGEASGITEVSRALVAAAPWAAWRERRRSNHEAFRAALDGAEGMRLLPAEGPAATAFSCVLLFPSGAEREAAKQRLIEARVYPAVLWPLEERAVDGISAGAIELSRRALSIHCDFRYDAADMQRVARLLL